MGIDTNIYKRISHGVEEGVPGREDTFKNKASKRKNISKIEADRAHFTLMILGFENL
jgi:hypothetical protein